jgi:hypothetical protein
LYLKLSGNLDMLYCSAIDYLSCSAANLPKVQLVDRSHQCPGTLPQLAELLIRDLPGYANRVAQRRRQKLDPNYSNYLAAGRPETIPQLIENPEYRPASPATAPLQLYLSTLEKRYVGRNSTDLQQFHWLFLAKGKKSWYLVAMYSRQGRTSDDPLPPIESLKSPVGEAVQIWLRDCNAGKIQP